MKGSIRRILLISNEKGYDLYLSKLLQNQINHEFEIDQVYPIEKAAGEINSGNYSSIILDIDGNEDCSTAAEKICAFNTYLPILVLSHHQNDTFEKAYKSGAQQVISKSHLDAQMLAYSILSSIDRKAIENEIHMRDEILKAVNNVAEIFLTQPNWDTYLSEVLESLGKATQSDHVSIIKNMDDSEDRTTGILQTEWWSNGVGQTDVIDRQHGIDYERPGFNRWKQLMKAGQAVWGDVEDLPAEEQASLMKLDIKSFIYIPIFIDHTWWGFIGFDRCTRRQNWNEVAVDALKTAAKILGAAISRQATEEKLTYLATHDYLTNLPNRMLFADRFNQATARSLRSGKKFAVISVDMDQFKSVNDTYGHQAGDEVLIEVGKRLTTTMRGTDTCARIGGDEFAIIAEEIHNKSDVIRIMEKICQAMQPKIAVENREIQTSASMGGSIYPQHGENLEELMKAADKALYFIKGTTTRFKIFSDDQISWLND
ncbi:MAG: diguanylate cyclase [Anaerolineae bacterium]|nr:diguanylate cyclase [Anaerolineae bacterium]